MILYTYQNDRISSFLSIYLLITVLCSLYIPTLRISDLPPHITHYTPFSSPHLSIHPAPTRPHIISS